MVESKIKQRNPDSEVPEMDEGWWASVLADEECADVHERVPSNRPCNPPSGAPVDWDCIKQIFEEDEIILLTVYGFNRGGLLVQGDSIQGFVPLSHLVDMPVSVGEDEKHSLLASYVGRSLYLKVIECEPSMERVVLSERAALAGEGKRKQLFNNLLPGTVTNGTVTNITEFGAFIDLGGVEGLVHVSELSWGRVEHPSELVQLGDPVRVLVLQVNEETSRIALSIKRLHPNPWDNLEELYQSGDMVMTTITSTTRYGAFARLPEGVEGLIHVSSMNLPGVNVDINKTFYPGLKVKVKILHIDSERRRLGLGFMAFDEQNEEV